jgi:GNAT superfamily N-acetyltransferase
VTVTEAAGSDIRALAGLMAATPLLQRYATTRETAQAALERGRDSGDMILVARCEDGAALGLAWVIAGRTLTGAAYLRLLLVAEGRQRGGAGARLLAEAEDRARRHANHLLLLVTADNAGARRFYERHGYRFVGTLPDFAVAGIDEALYQKALRSHAERLPV